ncbi:MAG: endonuclease domain-containing protein [Chitinophagaceae bacterium]|nr:endonuclease domain-containing protein [Chitinophagaceae bacterium]
MSSPIKFARELRQQMTEEESLLWELLRSRKLSDMKFRRQHPIIIRTEGVDKEFYIADFYCAKKRLVIELDGHHHRWHEQKKYDEVRDELIRNKGIRILRISNEELKNISQVLKKIQHALFGKSTFQKREL